MKTIEETALKYANSKFDELKDAFKAGVEFAQRWISVEEELPEEQGYYLVKCKNFPKKCNIVVAIFYVTLPTFYSVPDYFPILGVTHWRPIELP